MSIHLTFRPALRRGPSCSVGGFTLVELLVAIGIVMVLAGLVMGVLGKTLERGWLAQSTNNLRQLATANFAYAADHGCFVPSENIQTNNKRWCGGRDSGDKAWDPTKGYLSDYLGNSKRVTACPLFREMLKGPDSFEEGAGGYGYNSTYVGGKPAWEMEPDGTRVSAKPTAMEHASTTVMFATSAYARADGLQEYPYIEPPFWDFGNGPTEWRPSPTVHFRFNGRAIVGWCDGRVTLESRQDRPDGSNPHGGDANAASLGWFGPDEENGFWNPARNDAR